MATPSSTGTPPQDGPVVYRLGSAVTARLLGLALMLAAVLVVLASAVVALAGLGFGVVAGVLALALLGVLALGWWLRARAYVVRCEPEGYRIGLVRGAGVKQERWSAVEDAVAAAPRGVPAVVLRLRDGRTTTIPVGLLAVDRDDFVRQVQRHLQHGQGLRPL